jgi:hypothetical protein
MRVTATMRWLGLALLGILIAVGVSIAASRLASQQIGLASQPISAGDALAPAAQGPKQHRPGQQSGNHRKTTPRRQMTTPSTPPTSSEPPTYAPPPAAPSTPSYEPGQPSGHDGEYSGGSGGGADD